MSSTLKNLNTKYIAPLFILLSTLLLKFQELIHWTPKIIQEKTSRTLKFQKGTLTDINRQFCSNTITTSKYTVLNFLPRNLLEQISRPANFYFIIIAILQSINEVSISQGKPTILLPLISVLLISAIKDILEDMKRHRSDNEENNRAFLVWRNPVDLNLQPTISEQFINIIRGFIGLNPLEKTTSESNNNHLNEFCTLPSRYIKVGDFVLINRDQSFPADMLMLNTATRDGGYCFVETSQLDGETNLKVKTLPEGLNKQSFKSNDGDEITENDYNVIRNYDGTLVAEPSNGVLDRFIGSMKLENQESSLNIDNILLRGSQLRNTPWVIGLVFYTGMDSKIRRNSTGKSITRIKRSSVEYKMNSFIKRMFIIQILICSSMGIANSVWESNNSNAIYLFLDPNHSLSGFRRVFTWFIILAQFVPISLLVSMELVKFWQAIFFNWDLKMMKIVKGTPLFTTVQTSGLNEELGQIQFIFSDKTGTLTENLLEFRKCVIGTTQYGTGETEISKASKERKKATQIKDNVISLQPDLEDLEIVEKDIIYDHVQFNQKSKLEKALRENSAPYTTVINPLKEDRHQAIRSRQFLYTLSLANTVFPVIISPHTDSRKPHNDNNKSRKNNINISSAEYMDDDSVTVDFKASSPDDLALTRFAEFMGYGLWTRKPPYVTLRVKDSFTGSYIPETFEQIALLDFTSKRKRMSVILKRRDGKVVMFCKGADSAICPLLSETDRGSNRWNFMIERLKRFGEQGLRTLVIASSEHDSAFWDDNLAKEYYQGVKDYQVETEDEKGHFKGSCSNMCRRCNLEERIEKAFNLNLIGATAIEDKLQSKVPETISSLIEANIRVWVLTGDKLETAINIGMACRLIDVEMEHNGILFIINIDNRNDLRKKLDELKEKIAELINIKECGNDNEDTITSAGLVVTSKSLSIATEQIEITNGDKNLLGDLLYIGMKCRSVIGCRLQPDQKALLVRLVQVRGVRCLSIGDGANDEPMIRAANVGVGIAGEEGTAAVRASDYAFAQFAFLSRLLLVHGHYCYRRISLLICYIFYKNATLSLTMFWYGWVSGQSGQPIYLEWAFQGYNILFTAFPILIFAIFDKDVSEKILSSAPQLYLFWQQGVLFNYKVFLRWIGFAIVHSLLCVYIPLYSFDSTSFDESGHSYDLWSVGMVIYLTLCTVVNLKLVYEVTAWTILHHISIWGSIALTVATLAILSISSVFATAGADYYGVLQKLMVTPNFWFLWLEVVLACFLIDFLYQCYERFWNPSPISVISEKERLDPNFALDVRDIYKPKKIILKNIPTHITPVKTKKLKHEKDKDDQILEKDREQKKISEEISTTGFCYSHTSGLGPILGFQNKP